MFERVDRVLLASVLLLPFVLSRCSPAGAQPVAGSIESGLEQLAGEIVAKSSQSAVDTIAVLPFPNTDGTCSVLGTYLADELIQAIFNVPGVKLHIIERAQIEALLREYKMGAGGLFNPTTTQKVGSITGAKALLLGTVTVIGDHIRINARIVATANGQTLSAAAIGIARNGEINGLLEQATTSSGGVCGAPNLGAPDTTTDVDSSTTNLTDTQMTSTDTEPLPGTRPHSYEGITFAAQNVSRGSDRKSVSVVLSLTDRLSNSVRAVLVGPPPMLIDNQAGVGTMSQANGIQVCGNFNGSDWCAANWSRRQWTTLSPGEPTMLLLRFSGDSGLTGSRVSLAASILLESIPAETGKGPQTLKTDPTVISVSLANLPVVQQPGPSPSQ